MKKSLGIVALLLGLGSLLYAATPQDQPMPGQNPYSNTTIIGSTNTVNIADVSLAPGTLNNGGTNISCRNCFTRILVGLTANASYFMLDDGVAGGTTVQFVVGGQIGSSGGLLTMPEDHLGPICTSAGGTTELKIQGAAQPSNFINYEGYTQCGQNIQGGLMR